MRDHAEAEHEDDRLHVERDGAGTEDGAARVGDMERDEPHGDGKDLVRISLNFTYILQIRAGGFDKRPVSW